MKKILAIALLAAGLAGSAPAVIIGADAGYLTDNKDSYLSARVGCEVKAANSLSHQLELEIGTTEHSEAVFTGTAKTRLTLLTLNYRAEMTGRGKFGYYWGAGAGLARVNFGFPGSGVPWISARDEVLTLQGFAGASCKISPNASLHLGLKYLWIDEMKIRNISAGIGGDLAIMAGLNFRF